MYEQSGAAEGPPGFELSLVYWWDIAARLQHTRSNDSEINPRTPPVETVRAMAAAGNYALITVAAWSTFRKLPQSYAGWLAQTLKDMVQDISTFMLKKSISASDMQSLYAAILDGKIGIAWPQVSWGCSIEAFTFKIPLMLGHTVIGPNPATMSTQFPTYRNREGFVKQKFDQDGLWHQLVDQQLRRVGQIQKTIKNL